MLSVSGAKGKALECALFRKRSRLVSDKTTTPKSSVALLMLFGD